MRTLRVIGSTNLPVLACLVAGCALSGCAGGGAGWFGGGEQTAEESALLDSTDQIVSRSVWQGAALGAAAGCGMGLLIGNDIGDCLIGSAGGAAVGGGAGYLVGANNAEAARAEYDEQALIDQLTTQEGQLRKVEDQLHTVLADQRRRLATMNADLAASELSEADYARQYEDMMAVREEVAADLEAAKQNRQQFAVKIVAWQDSGIDARAVDRQNTANLAKIDELLALARHVEPSAI